MPKILVVEDDRDIHKMVKDWLTMERHSVESAFDGNAALDFLTASEFDVVILDWQLPGMEGIDVLRQYRQMGGKAPVIMLTGKDSIMDKTAGLDGGCDDYLTKPFHLEELAARLRALLRRTGARADQILEAGAFILDTQSHRLTIDGKDVRLLPREFSLLEFFMRNQGKVYSADALLNRVWESDAEVSKDAIITCIKRLRQKLDPQEGPSCITTVHGVGYRFDPPAP